MESLNCIQSAVCDAHSSPSCPLPHSSPATHLQGMESLNRIQSAVCEAALFSSDNLLMCAPTGAGKTNVAMLTIMHQVRC